MLVDTPSLKMLNDESGVVQFKITFLLFGVTVSAVGTPETEPFAENPKALGFVSVPLFVGVNVIGVVIVGVTVKVWGAEELSKVKTTGVIPLSLEDIVIVPVYKLFGVMVKFDVGLLTEPTDGPVNVYDVPREVLGVIELEVADAVEVP